MFFGYRFWDRGLCVSLLGSIFRRYFYKEAREVGLGKGELITVCCNEVLVNFVLEKELFVGVVLNWGRGLGLFFYVG